MQKQIVDKDQPQVKRNKASSSGKNSCMGKRDGSQDSFKSVNDDDIDGLENNFEESKDTKWNQEKGKEELVPESSDFDTCAEDTDGITS